MQGLFWRLVGTAAALIAANLAAAPSMSQTKQDAEWCSRDVDDADNLIQGCSAFIRSGRSIHGQPIPINEMWPFFQLRSLGYMQRGEYDLAITDLN